MNPLLSKKFFRTKATPQPGALFRRKAAAFQIGIHISDLPQDLFHNLRVRAAIPIRIAGQFFAQHTHHWHHIRIRQRIIRNHICLRNARFTQQQRRDDTRAVLPRCEVEKHRPG